MADALTGLAAVYNYQGRHGEEEPLTKRALTIYERSLGPEHPRLVSALNNLAALYSMQGRYAEAEPLAKRTLAIREKARGSEDPSVAWSLGSIAQLYAHQERYVEAELLAKRALAIQEKAFGPQHPTVADALDDLAALYLDQGRYAEAEPLAKRTLAIREAALGPMHPHLALSLKKLAKLYAARGRHFEAESLAKRTLAIREAALGLKHSGVAIDLNDLARLRLEQGDFAGAAESWQRATAILAYRAELGLGGSAGGSSRAEAQRNSGHFDGLIKTTHRLSAEGGGNAKQVSLEMFETAQWARSSEAARSLALMALRGASADPVLATLVRERQDLAAEWQGKDNQLVVARGNAPEKRNAQNEMELVERLGAIDVRVAEIDTIFKQKFRNYATLTSPKPATLAEVQAKLGDDEALVVFLDTDDGFKPLPEETFVWVVTKTDVRWVGSKLGTAALTEKVKALRCGLDPASWESDSEACLKLTGGPAPGADTKL
ncbi:MAG: hypothetical protein B7Y80_21215, partial [Hyphomicrobium sp. 32-62-53]